jgi:TRAP-type C4-dicarboxylate transport system permease small subunit
MVPFAIVCTGWLKRHVSVDLFVSRLTPRPRRILDIFNWLLTLVLFVFIVRQCIVFTLFTYSDKVQSSVLYIPAYPFVAAIVLGLGIFCIVLTVQLIDIILTRTKK